MTASFEGHVDIVRTLIEAKAQVNTQKEVWLLLPPETYCTTHRTFLRVAQGACALEQSVDNIYIYIYTNKQSCH